MKKTVLVASLIFLFFGCYCQHLAAQSWFNGLDTYDTTIHWINNKNIDSLGAYSEIYFAISSPQKPYGLGVENDFPKIIRGKNTTVYITGFVKMPKAQASGIYVFTLEKAGKSIFWQGIDLSKIVKDRQHWFRFADTIVVPANITRNGKIKAYLWNTSKKGDIYLDDLKFSFVPKHHPRFLPDLKIGKNDTLLAGTAKTLFQNPFYKIKFNTSDTTLQLTNHDNQPLVSNLYYFTKRQRGKDTIQQTKRWIFRKTKKRNEEIDLIFSLKTKYSKAILEIGCSPNSPEIKYSIREKYNRKQLIYRNALILESAIGITEVYRSNRQSDRKNFQNEYWLDKEGATFGKGARSWTVYHCPHISSMQFDRPNNRLIVNIDYQKDHPFMRFPLQPDSVDWKVDFSSSRHKRGDKTEHSFTLTADVSTSPLPRLMKNPDGYLSTYIWTEHADYSDIRTNRATYFGSEKITQPDSAVGGFVKYGIPITKSVFYDNPDSVRNTNDSGGKITSLECSIMDDTAFRDFLFKIRGFHTDICLHTPEQFTTTRPRLKTALRYMQKHFHSKCWIDHGNNNGLQNNREDLICDGTLKNSPYYALDLWKKYGVQYLHDAYYEEMNSFAGWQFGSSIEKPYRGFGDFFPKPDYWQHPTRTDAMYHWPTTKVLYVKTDGMWDYLFNPVQFSLFTEDWGIEINHCYPARVHQTKGFWTYNHQGEIVSAKGFDKTLEAMQKLHRQGILYLSTLSDYLDYRIALEQISYRILSNSSVVLTNHSNTELKGVSLAVKAKAVLVDGLKPKQKRVDNDLIFSLNLKQGQSALIRIVK